jgi:hypothetical protein
VSWTLARVEDRESGQAAVRCRVVTDATLARANQLEEQAKQPDLLDMWVIFMDISAGQGGLSSVEMEARRGCCRSLFDSVC